MFVDELDAVGGRRSMERQYARQTLNQLLTELDGFEEHSGVIVIGATNLPEVLDPALVRPGRFDTLVHVNLPDVRGRLAVLKLHSRKVHLAAGGNSLLLMPCVLFSGLVLLHLCTGGQVMWCEVLMSLARIGSLCGVALSLGVCALADAFLLCCASLTF